MKYQLDFTKYFGPDHAYGVTDVAYSADRDAVLATARVKPIHQSTKGAETSFNVPMGKFKVWRANVKLFKFISVK